MASSPTVVDPLILRCVQSLMENPMAYHQVCSDLDTMLRSLQKRNDLKVSVEGLFETCVTYGQNAVAISVQLFKSMSAYQYSASDGPPITFKTLLIAYLQKPPKPSQSSLYSFQRRLPFMNAMLRQGLMSTGVFKSLVSSSASSKSETSIQFTFEICQNIIFLLNQNVIKDLVVKETRFWRDRIQHIYKVYSSSGIKDKVLVGRMEVFFKTLTSQRPYFLSKEEFFNSVSTVTSIPALSTSTPQKQLVLMRTISNDQVLDNQSLNTGVPPSGQPTSTESITNEPSPVIDMNSSGSPMSLVLDSSMDSPRLEIVASPSSAEKMKVITLALPSAREGLDILLGGTRTDAEVVMFFEQFVELLKSRTNEFQVANDIRDVLERLFNAMTDNDERAMAICLEIVETLRDFVLQIQPQSVTIRDVISSCAKVIRSISDRSQIGEFCVSFMVTNELLRVDAIRRDIYQMYILEMASDESPIAVELLFEIIKNYYVLLKQSDIELTPTEKMFWTAANSRLRESIASKRYESTIPSDIIAGMNNLLEYIDKNGGWEFSRTPIEVEKYREKEMENSNAQQSKDEQCETENAKGKRKIHFKIDSKLKSLQDTSVDLANDSAQNLSNSPIKTADVSNDKPQPSKNNNESHAHSNEKTSEKQSEASKQKAENKTQQVSRRQPDKQNSSSSRSKDDRSRSSSRSHSQSNRSEKSNSQHNKQSSRDAKSRSDRSMQDKFSKMPPPKSQHQSRHSSNTSRNSNRVTKESPNQERKVESSKSSRSPRDKEKTIKSGEPEKNSKSPLSSTSEKDSEKESQVSTMSQANALTSESPKSMPAEKANREISCKQQDKAPPDNGSETKKRSEEIPMTQLEKSAGPSEPNEKLTLEGPAKLQDNPKMDASCDTNIFQSHLSQVESDIRILVKVLTLSPNDKSSVEAVRAKLLSPCSAYEFTLAVEKVLLKILEQEFSANESLLDTYSKIFVSLFKENYGRSRCFVDVFKNFCLMHVSGRNSHDLEKLTTALLEKFETSLNSEAAKKECDEKLDSYRKLYAKRRRGCVKLVSKLYKMSELDLDFIISFCDSMLVARSEHSLECLRQFLSDTGTELIEDLRRHNREDWWKTFFDELVASCSSNDCSSSCKALVRKIVLLKAYWPDVDGSRQIRAKVAELLVEFSNNENEKALDDIVQLTAKEFSDGLTQKYIQVFVDHIRDMQTKSKSIVSATPVPTVVPQIAVTSDNDDTVQAANLRKRRCEVSDSDGDPCQSEVKKDR